MPYSRPFVAARVRRGLALLALVALVAGALACSSGSSSSGTPGAAKDKSGITRIQPADLAARLKASGEKPALVHVGFRTLYREGAIPGSVYAGPASRPEGVDALKKALAPLPRTRTVVLYCGCCPWSHCPNVLPAYNTARGMGFKDVRVLFVQNDLDRDWAGKGYPIAKPAD